MKLNDIIYFIILLVIVLLMCLKAIDLHKNIAESFENNNNNNEDVNLENAAENYYDETTNNSDNNSMSDEELDKKCKIRKKKSDFGSIISKYSGKVINVEKQPNKTSDKVKYLIKWEPVGGKAGGCITANADGSYSTPICNFNIDKQLWEIIEVKDEEQFTKLIKDFGGEDRLTMGRPLDETNYPFHIVMSNNFVLNYEGGGLSIRKIANYDSQKWDVSTESLKQEPMPTQNFNKESTLTPGHNITQTDMNIQNKYQNPVSGNSSGGDDVNLNINVDNRLLRKLLGESVEDLNNSNNNSDNDLLLDEDTLYKNKFNRNISSEDASSMELNRSACENCDGIPERYIRKEDVKSMCIGWDNIDNVKT